MKYIAILNEIGGKTHTLKFDAEDNSHAATKLNEEIKEKFNNDENRLHSVVYYQYNSEYQVNIDLWYRDFK